MHVDWELSESLTSDGEGIRAVGAPPVAGILIGGGSGDNSSSTESDNNKQDNSDDSFSLLTGTQGGAIYSFTVPNHSTGHHNASIQSLTNFQHDHSVTAILVGRRICVTGCKDGIIRLYRYNNSNNNSKDNSSNNIILLKGHEKAVTSLAWASLENDDDRQDDAEFIVSGSWDGTAKVWKVDATTAADSCCIATLPGHENSVCVAFIPPPPLSGSKYLRIATGSAGVAQNNTIRDHAVRLWQVDATMTLHGSDNVKLVQTCANDHDGPIRDILCLTSSSSSSSSSTSSPPQYHQMLATCSNDGTVKLRSADTLQATSTLTFLQQAQEHPPMLLSLCFVQDCLIASAEDGNVIAWDLHLSSNDGTVTTVGEPQLIRHATTVWQVRGLPNHDFCSASDDGMLRIFTRARDRMASVQERQAFQLHVQEALDKQTKTSQGGPSAEEVAKLPHWHTDNARKQGTSEGQVQLFQKDGIAIAAQWSMASSSWIEVGQVTGSRDTGTIDGVTYDHVLPIEIDNTQTAAAAGNAGGGVATLQLGYNNGENPFTAAQRFIDAHMLPQHYLSQIADYIQQRLGQAAAGAPTLGGSTTGTTRPAATTGVPIAAYYHLPIKAMQLFELPPSNSAASTLDKMKAKIQAFDILKAEHVVQVEQLCSTLLKQATTSATIVTIPQEQLTIISTMLNAFPPHQAFPALDLARMVASCPSRTATALFWDQVMQQAIRLCKEASSEAAAPVDPADKGPAPAVAIPMLSLRLFSNLIAAAAASNRDDAMAAQQVVAMHVSSLLEIARAHIKSSNKNIRLSIATLLHNLCYYLYLQKSNTSTATTAVDDMDIASAASSNMDTLTLVPEIMPLLGEIISSYYKIYEEPALLRIFQALGTWIIGNDGGSGTNNNEVKAAANALYLAVKVEMAASHHSAGCKAAAKEVYSVLQS
jgi:phospholipase A-2-activating protein